MTIAEWLVTPVEPDARVLSMCCHDDYCVGAVTTRCPCCELTFCDNHTAASLLCLGCDDWCERQDAS